MTEPETEQTAADAVPALLHEASLLWQRTCGYYGVPGDLYRRGFLPPRTHRTAADWIRCLEMLVRRIILLMALAIDPPLHAVKTAASKGDKPAPEIPARKPFQAARLAFIVMPPVRTHRSHHAGRNRDLRPRTRGLARRLDALWRVLCGPAPYARRTALSLARIAQAKLAPHLDPEAPLIGLHPWLIHTSRRTFAQDEMYDIIDHAQTLAQRGLDGWHARLRAPRPQDPG